jgi:hypothetical protein
VVVAEGSSSSSSSTPGEEEAGAEAQIEAGVEGGNHAGTGAREGAVEGMKETAAASRGGRDKEVEGEVAREAGPSRLAATREGDQGDRGTT